MHILCSKHCWDRGACYQWARERSSWQQDKGALCILQAESCPAACWHWGLALTLLSPHTHGIRLFSCQKITISKYNYLLTWWECIYVQLTMCLPFHSWHMRMWQTSSDTVPTSAICIWTLLSDYQHQGAMSHWRECSLQRLYHIAKLFVHLPALTWMHSDRQAACWCDKGWIMSQTCTPSALKILSPGRISCWNITFLPMHEVYPASCTPVKGPGDTTQR